MGNWYRKFQKVIPGRQREQECGCCLPLWEGFRATWGRGNRRWRGRIDSRGQIFFKKNI